MLRSVEIRTVLTGVAHGGDQFHALHFLPEVELSLDCFMCQRTGRTMILTTGTEQALCTPDEKHGHHPTAARILCMRLGGRVHDLRWCAEGQRRA
jgi:hypothetical protein